MSKTLIILMVMFQAACLSAQSEYVTLLKASAERIKALKTVEYNFTAESYFQSGHFTRTSTHVTLLKEQDGNKSYYKFEGERYLTVWDDTLNFAFGKSEKGFQMVYHDEKKHYLVDDDVMPLSAFNRIAILLIGSDFDHFHRKAPLNADDIQTARFEGVTTYGGVSCYDITVPSKESKDGIFHWYIAMEDSLPRGYSLTERMTELELLRYDFEPTAEQVEITSPEDYELVEVTPRNVGEVNKLIKEASTEELPFKKGTAFPSWNLVDLEGKSWNSQDLLGKVVLIDFWGVWCVPCVKAMPKVQAIYDEFKEKGVVVLGFDVRDSEEKIRKFINKNGYTYPIFPDTQQLSRSWQVSRFPTMIILGKDGTVLHGETGFRSNAFEEWKAVIERELGSN